VEIQRASYNGNLRTKAALHFIWNNMERLPFGTTVEAILYFGMHARSRNWYSERIHNN
jgi:hypothetical protein